jgi:hypothetical protein
VSVPVHDPPQAIPKGAGTCSFSADTARAAIVNAIASSSTSMAGSVSSLLLLLHSEQCYGVLAPTILGVLDALSRRPLFNRPMLNELASSLFFVISQDAFNARLLFEPALAIEMVRQNTLIAELALMSDLKTTTAFAFRRRDPHKRSTASFLVLYNAWCERPVNVEELFAAAAEQGLAHAASLWLTQIFATARTGALLYPTAVAHL